MQSFDYKRIYESMAKPAFIFDGRVMLDHEHLIDIGFRVHSVGRRGEKLRVGVG
jgi:UDPglucose 6-dehydrogenase